MISFGVFSDVHYAAEKTYGNRYCDLSISKLDACIQTFNERGLPFAVSLGDLIDSAESVEKDIENLQKVNTAISQFKGDMHTVLGNHDLASMSKHQFLNVLKAGKKDPYYSFDVGNCRFILLDTNYTSRGEAYTCGHSDWTDASIPEGQKKWLHDELNSSTHDHIMICVHHNLDDRRWNDDLDPHIIKNANEIRGILLDSGKKIAVIQGHYHHGYYQKIDGISYLTVKAMCEGGSVSDNAYSMISIHDDGKITAEGFGQQPDVLFE